jgi:hypothetical protein
MALTDSMVLCKDPRSDIGSAVAEAMKERQPGDELEIKVKVRVVENLTDRSTYDVKSVEFVGGASASADEEDDDEPADKKTSVLAASVLGVMKKKPASGY